MGGGGVGMRMNHMGYQPNNAHPAHPQYSGQMAVSDNQIRRGNPHISSYSQHDLGNEPPPPVPVSQAPPSY